MSTKLIVNADDFGASSAVNRAVIKAHQDGVLTSASLMVAGKSMDEAVAMAQDNPRLAVGLHLTLTDGFAVLPKEKILSLIDANGRFTSNPAVAGLKYFFSPEARKELKSEIEAQFGAFARTGLTLSHIDGHQHIHAHPTVLLTVVELAIKYGAKGIRVPHDPFWINMLIDQSRPVEKSTVAAAHAYLAALCRRKIRKTSLASCDYAIGSMMSGHMNADYAIKMLDKVKADTIEIYFHPSESPREAASGPNAGDLQTLLSPKLKEFIQMHDYKLTNYAGIAGDSK